MRSLVPIVSLLLAALPVFALSKTKPAPPANAPKTASITVIQLGNGPIQADPDTAKKILASPKMRAQVEKALADANAAEHACFTMETYAPVGQKPASTTGALEKPYVPQKFELRSTCSSAGKIENLPAGRIKK